MIQKFNSNVFPIKFYGMHEPQYKTYDTDEIIDLCRKNNYRKIGLVPNGMNYTNQIKLFEQHANGFPNVIRYFHLNKDDFIELYNKNGG